MRAVRMYLVLGAVLSAVFAIAAGLWALSGFPYCASSGGPAHPERWLLASLFGGAGVVACTVLAFAADRPERAERESP